MCFQQRPDRFNTRRGYANWHERLWLPPAWTLTSCPQARALRLNTALLASTTESSRSWLASRLNLNRRQSRNQIGAAKSVIAERIAQIRKQSRRPCHYQARPHRAVRRSHRRQTVGRPADTTFFANSVVVSVILGESTWRSSGSCFFCCLEWGRGNTVTVDQGYVAT